MAEDNPPVFNYILSFILVGLAWGFTTPFIRRAALTYTAPSVATHPSLSESRPWISRKAALAFWTLLSLLSKPSYAVPLVANLTGSIWFFLLVGQAGKLTSYVVKHGISVWYWQMSSSTESASESTKG